MTALEPIPPSSDTLAQIPDELRRTPDNVRFLDSRRGVVGPHRGTVDAAVLEAMDSEIVSATTDPEVAGKHDPFLDRIRAWMVVPPVDFAMLVAPVLWHSQVYAIAALALIGTALLSGGARYRAPLHLSVLDELPNILTRLLAAVAAVVGLLLLLNDEAAAIGFLQASCAAAGLVVVGRVITTRIIAFVRRRGVATYRTVVIGGGPMAAELARILDEYPMYGLKVVGFVDDGDRFPAAEYVSRLGGLADLDRAVATTGAKTLLVADGNFSERDLMDAVRTARCQDNDLLVVPRMHHFHTVTGSSDHIGSIPVMRIRNPNLHGPARMIKRAFDVVVAGTAMTLLAPVLVAAALAVRIEGGRGVIFRQVRVGHEGKHFALYKFRTLRASDETESQTLWCVTADERIGPVGRFLRSTSIDELPQLWNILRGNMTLVGPRPERPHFVEQFSEQIDRYAYRHRVQAGLTGFAQVSGLRGDTSVADRARYDNFYIENWSLWLDIKIILRTFREVIMRRGC